jgi:BlaI family transcriptional regulator, penicillinase repressor
MSTKLSTLEWAIMEVLWAKAPLSASEVYETLPNEHDCHVKTVRSLLDRMLKKEAVRREKKHGVWIFHPALEKEASLLKESQSFLQRFFSAQPVPLIAHLVENDVLSNQELDQLRQLIDERGRDTDEGVSHE